MLKQCRGEWVNFVLLTFLCSWIFFGRSIWIWLTLCILKLFLCILYYFTTLTSRGSWNLCLWKDPFILHSQYCSCWWLDLARSQGINSHSIDLVLPVLSASSPLFLMYSYILLLELYFWKLLLHFLAERCILYIFFYSSNFILIRASLGSSE